MSDQTTNDEKTPIPPLTSDDLLGYARHNDSLVNQMVQANRSHEEIIFRLVKRHEDMIEKFLDLDSINPKRYKVDGKEMIWHCPDDLIPLVDLDKSKA